MSWRVRAAFVVLAALCAAVPARAQDAAETAQAKATLRSYFAALNAQECDEVERLRPGYGGNCGATEAVTVDTVAFEGQAGGLQVFKVQGRVTRGQPAPFSLFFPLENRDGRWVIVHDAVGATFDLDAHRILADVGDRAGEATAPPPARRAPPPAKPSPPVPPPEPETRASAPEMLAPEHRIVTELPDSTAQARAAIDRYYHALREHRCADAQELRPEQSIADCERVTAVEDPEIVSLEAYQGFELFHVAATLTLGAETDAFVGFVAVKQRFPDWVIVSGLVMDDLPLDEYRNLVVQHLEETSAPPPPDTVYAPETVLEWGQDLPPAEAGSATVLGACWPAEDLPYRAREKQSYTSGPDTFMGPPARLSPHTGIASLPPAYRGSIRSVDTHGVPYIALTFDVCEQNNDHAGYDGEIVDYLRAQGIPATFYLGGKWMATHPERAMQLIADPRFETGNHAWTHGNMRVLGREDPEEAENQILFTQAQYEVLREKLLARAAARGVSGAARAAIPAQLATFRAPYGACDPQSLALINRFGLPAVQWSIVSGDPDRSQTAQDIATGILHQAHPGAIVVMHANGRGWNTAAAVRLLVPALRDKGYLFVTVSELLTLGAPVTKATCYENHPGDNDHYDRIFGRGTGD